MRIVVQRICYRDYVDGQANESARKSRGAGRVAVRCVVMRMIYARWFFHVFALALLIGAPVGGAETISIGSFGAKADDHIDDTRAFLDALKACIASPGVTLSLSPGVYDVGQRSTPPDGASPPLLVIKQANGLTIDGNGAEIVCHDFATLFWFENGRDITIRNLKVDYDPLPFTAGQIIAEGDGTVDLRIEPHHPLQAGLRAESLLPFDPGRHRMGSLKEDLYQPDLQKRTQRIDDRTLRVPVTRQLFHVGDWVILRHQIYSKNAFDFLNCQRVAMENVTVYTCPGMALHANGGADFSLHHFDVAIKPGTGRWFTATADATHFNGVRGKVTLDQCLLESMGDDGANIHNWYLRVTDPMDAKTFKCELGKDPHWDPPLPRAGDVLEIGRSPNPLLPMLTATVANAHLDTANDHTAVITLTAAPARAIEHDDVVGDASTLPIADVHDCTIRRNRARGVLIQTRNAIVHNCTFEDISGAAVQITCDTGRWWEGMPTRDVTVRDNTITRVNFGIGSRDATIDIFADLGRLPSPDPVHRHIVIEDNKITDVTTAAIHVGSATDVTILGNTFSPPVEHPVIVDHSTAVSSDVRTSPTLAK
jgi:hypothetical protein